MNINELYEEYRQPFRGVPIYVHETAISSFTICQQIADKVCNDSLARRYNSTSFEHAIARLLSFVGYEIVDGNIIRSDDCDDTNIVLITEDMLLSFYWIWRKVNPDTGTINMERFAMNGGLIFHQDKDSNSLQGVWRMHT